MEPRKIQRYGWRKDMPDPRDRIWNLEEKVWDASALPRAVDLTGQMPAVYDQLQLGSCTANATAGIFEHRMMRENETAVTPSRLFIYYEERRLEGQPLDQDTGAEVRDGIKVLFSEGVPPESEWPYSDANPGPFQVQPGVSAYADASKHKALAYKRIIPGGRGAPVRSAINAGCPIAFGFPVPAMFEDQSWDQSSTPLPLPDASTQFVGGHAVVIVGYDFSCSRFRVPVFKVRNSWGPGWGEQGHYYMDYRWPDPAGNLAADLWVISKST